MLFKTSHICVVDEEATCWDDPALKHRNAMEIIEIGSVLVDADTLAVVSEFQSYVKPCTTSELSAFCTGLTGITQRQVDMAPGFVEARKNWLAAMAELDPGSVLFASWGRYDYKQLLKDCQLHGVQFPFRGDHLNIKQYVGKKAWGRSKGTGLGKAINRLGMKFEGTPHSGICDARNTAKILMKVGFDRNDMGEAYAINAEEIMRGWVRG